MPQKGAKRSAVKKKGKQGCDETLPLSYKIYVALGYWTCDAQQFDCDRPQPKCISKSQVCNKHQDCSEGNDEDPNVCGMSCIIFFTALGSTLFFFMQNAASFYLLNIQITTRWCTKNTHIYSPHMRKSPRM